jgi:MarR family protein
VPWLPKQLKGEEALEALALRQSLVPRTSKIIKILLEAGTPLYTHEIRQRTGMTTHVMSVNLNKLRRRGLVERVGPRQWAVCQAQVKGLRLQPTWKEVAKEMGISRQTLHRRLAWLRENYEMRAGITPDWNSRPHRHMPNSGMFRKGKPQRGFHLPVPEGYVPEEPELPEFKPPTEMELLEGEIRAARALKTVLTWDQPHTPDSPENPPESAPGPPG